MILRTILSAAVVASALACAPPYGRQGCEADSECPSGQFCPSSKASANYSCDLPDRDAGADVVSTKAICAKACATDDDCADLGLKKPKCVTLQCAGGGKTCTDYPF